MNAQEFGGNIQTQLYVQKLSESFLHFVYLVPCISSEYYTLWLLVETNNS